MTSGFAEPQNLILCEPVNSRVAFSQNRLRPLESSRYLSLTNRIAGRVQPFGHRVDFAAFLSLASRDSAPGSHIHYVDQMLQRRSVYLFRHDPELTQVGHAK